MPSSFSMVVLSPEGNKVQFVEAPARSYGFVLGAFAPNAIGHHIIHVGYMVHDRALEDTFYRDLLGFRPYWWGGRGGKVESVHQQCPDGHDWMEYMMTRGTAGIPADMTQRELGAMDHFSIGVVSVPDVRAWIGNRLRSNLRWHSKCVIDELWYGELRYQDFFKPFGVAGKRDT